MKKLFVSIFALLAVSFSISAQESTPAQQERQESKAAYRGSKKDKKDKLAALHLTPDQKKELKENRAEYKAKLAALDKDQTLSETERNAKKAALKKEKKSGTQALLTPQQREQMKAAKMQDRKEDKAHAEKRLSDMKKELALSDEQVTQLRAFDVSYHAKIKGIRNDNSLDETTRAKQIEGAKQANETRRRSILTADQVKKLDAMKNNHTRKGPGRAR